MAIPDWVRFRLLYLEYLSYAGIAVALPLIGAALTSNTLSKGTLIGILGTALVVIGARSKQNPREAWEENYRESERKRKIAELAEKQAEVAKAAKEVADKLAEVKRDESKP